MDPLDLGIGDRSGLRDRSTQSTIKKRQNVRMP